MAVPEQSPSFGKLSTNKSELEMNSSESTETHDDDNLEADSHRIHSQIEILLRGLRVDGNGSASQSKIVKAIRDGESLESVLSIATQLVTQNAETHRKL